MKTNSALNSVAGLAFMLAVAGCDDDSPSHHADETDASILHTYNLSIGDVIEFVPNSDEDTLCIFVEGVREAGLDCIPRGVGKVAEQPPLGEQNYVIEEGALGPRVAEFTPAGNTDYKCVYVEDVREAGLDCFDLN